MAGDFMLDGPKPPRDSGLGWCTVCAMLVKGNATGPSGRLQDEIKKIPDDQVKWLVITGDDTRQWGLALAVAWGTYPPMIQMGVMPLCWSHLMGMEVKSAVGMPATPQEMAALAQGGRVLGGGRPPR